MNNRYLNDWMWKSTTTTMIRACGVTHRATIDKIINIFCNDGQVQLFLGYSHRDQVMKSLDTLRMAEINENAIKRMVQLMCEESTSNAIRSPLTSVVMRKNAYMLLTTISADYNTDAMRLAINDVVSSESFKSSVEESKLVIACQHELLSHYARTLFTSHEDNGTLKPH